MRVSCLFFFIIVPFLLFLTLSSILTFPIELLRLFPANFFAPGCDFPSINSSFQTPSSMYQQSAVPNPHYYGAEVLTPPLERRV